MKRRWLAVTLGIAALTLLCVTGLLPARISHAQSETNPGVVSLIGWWDLDEAVSSGTRYDSHINHLDLTDNNTVNYNTGKVGNAADLVSANSEWLSHASNSMLQAGSIDMTVGCWVYLNNTSSPYQLFSKGSPSEFGLWFNSGTGHFRFDMSGLSGGTVSIQDTNSVAATTWYLVIGWHEASSNTYGIQINNNSPVTGVNAATVGVVGDGEFDLGRLASGSRNMNGRLDACFYYKRVWSSTERAWDWNSGSGHNYADLDQPTATPTNTATNTPTSTDTPTDTPTATSTSTATETPTSTLTNTPAATATPTSTATATLTPTATLPPTNTPTPSPIPYEWIGTLPVSGREYRLYPSATYGEIGGVMATFVLTIAVTGLGLLILFIWIYFALNRRGPDVSNL